MARKSEPMVPVSDLHERWMGDPEYRREYEALEEEFALVDALIRARARAGLSQAEVASRMGTTQSAIARLEGGKVRPGLATLRRYAKATGSRLRVALDAT